MFGPVFMHPSRTLLFFFNDTATTEIYTLSLHDALPISIAKASSAEMTFGSNVATLCSFAAVSISSHMSDRKSTRLNSRHLVSSHAVFCLKKALSAVTAEPDLRRRVSTDIDPVSILCRRF